MTSRSVCSECGAPLRGGAPGGACPACLLAEGLDAPPDGVPSRTELAAAFPDLEIGALLGRGGMGAVFEARQRKLERRVALKVLPRQEAGRAQDFADRFEREARALARLDHPNIVHVYEFGERDGLHYLLMEFVDGVNLRDAMNDGRMTPVEALAVVPQICDALQYAHDQGVVHRDIKPENVLLTAEGVVKVADFGLAKLVTGPSGPDPTLTRAGQVMGTAHYMAPEQVESPSSVDHRADIYSLGVVFYELLTGDLPLGRFEPPSERVRVDARLDRVVLRALEKKRERRFQRAAEVRTAVDAITDPGDGAALPPRAPRNGVRPDWSPPGGLRGYSKRALLAFALVPGVVVFAASVAVLALVGTDSKSLGYQWGALAAGGGIFVCVAVAISALAPTSPSGGKKGRWIAVLALVSALVAVPILLWASYWLFDVSGNRALGRAQAPPPLVYAPPRGAEIGGTPEAHAGKSALPDGEEAVLLDWRGLEISPDAERSEAVARLPRDVRLLLQGLARQAGDGEFDRDDARGLTGLRSSFGDRRPDERLARGSQGELAARGGLAVLVALLDRERVEDAAVVVALGEARVVEAKLSQEERGARIVARGDRLEFTFGVVLQDGDWMFHPAEATVTPIEEPR